MTTVTPAIRSVGLYADGAVTMVYADATRALESQNIADMLCFALWQTGDPDFQ